MLRRTFAFLCLASLGALCDQALRATLFGRAEPQRLGRVGENLTAAATSPDGSRVAGLRNLGPEQWTVTVWETRSGRQLLSATLPHPPGTSTPLAWSPDGKVLAAGSSGEVSLWEVSSGRRQVLNAEWLVREVRFSQNWLLARCDNTVFVWDWQTRKLVRRIGQDHLLAAALDRTSGALATASFQDSVRVYSLPQGKLVRTLPAGPATVNLEFTEKGERLAAAFRYRNERARDVAAYYDWRAGSLVSRMAEPDLVGFSVAEDGSRFLTRSPQGGHIWDPRQGQSLLEFQLPSLHTDSLSPDGRQVLSLPSGGGQAVLWSSDGQGARRELPGDGTPFRFQFFARGMVQVLDGACSVWKVE